MNNLPFIINSKQHFPFPYQWNLTPGYMFHGFTDSDLIHILLPLSHHISQGGENPYEEGNLRSNNHAHGYSHILSHPRLCHLGTPCPLHTIGSRLSGTFYDSTSLCGHSCDFSLCFSASSWFVFLSLSGNGCHHVQRSLASPSQGKEAGVSGGGSLVLYFRFLKVDANLNAPQMHSDEQQTKMVCLRRPSHQIQDKQIQTER